MRSALTLLLLGILSQGFSQETITFSGKVLDSKNQHAVDQCEYRVQSILIAQRLMNRVILNSASIKRFDDTIFISYVGYTPFADKVINLTTSYQFYRLEESSNSS